MFHFFTKKKHFPLFFTNNTPIFHFFTKEHPHVPLFYIKNISHFVLQKNTPYFPLFTESTSHFISCLYGPARDDFGRQQGACHCFCRRARKPLDTPLRVAVCRQMTPPVSRFVREYHDEGAGAANQRRPCGHVTGNDVTDEPERDRPPIVADADVVTYLLHRAAAMR